MSGLVRVRFSVSTATRDHADVRLAQPKGEDDPSRRESKRPLPGIIPEFMLLDQIRGLESNTCVDESANQLEAMGLDWQQPHLRVHPLTYRQTASTLSTPYSSRLTWGPV